VVAALSPLGKVAEAQHSVRRAKAGERRVPETAEVGVQKADANPMPIKAPGQRADGVDA
jgi:hypothetical protein